MKHDDTTIFNFGERADEVMEELAATGMHGMSALAEWEEFHRQHVLPIADRGPHKLLPEYGQLRPGQTVELNGLPNYGWAADNGEYAVVEIWQCRDMINSARALLRAGHRTLELSINVRGQTNDAFASIRVIRDAKQMSLRGIA